MKPTPTRLARTAILTLLVAGLAGCGLPRGGPTKGEIFSGSVQRQGDAYIVPVTSRVNRLTALTPASGFDASLINAGVLGSDTIRPGDTLGLTIYENVDNGLLVSGGAPAAALNEIQVDSAGFIFVPYAGRIRAAGNTPEAIRRIITDALDEQTPDPQVQVRRVAGDGAAVSVVGGVASQGVYSINRPNRMLSGMLARAGGLRIPEESAQITVIRNGQRGRVFFEDLYQNPRLDIALRDGDRILVEQDDRSFTVLGSTGQQAEVNFTKQSLTAIEAIARVGGLRSAISDPTGVFVFRDEPESIARDVLGTPNLVGPQRVVYVLDLTEPNGMFDAREFQIRDEDTLYVTEAPYVQFQKIIGALTGTAGSAARLANTADVATGDTN